MIRFYFNAGPNPMKVALMLEETSLVYEVVPVDMLAGDQHTPDFLAINPNAKVPAIVDGDIVVFDSNAILLYLAEKTGKFLGSAAERPTMLSWLMFVATGLGPYSGQSVHFSRMHTDSAYATNRYKREAERHYDVLDARLAKVPFLVGEDYGIVDMAAWGWVDRRTNVLGADVDLGRWTNLARWLAAIEARPAVQRARKVGAGHTWKNTIDEAALRAMFPQNFAAS
jgi:GST-like protein